MTLLSPLSLLWFLPAAGAILALYFLRLRRRDVPVPSLLLWSRAVRDVQANAPFQRLRFRWLLVLQLLLALLLSLALAEPVVRATALGGRRLVVVLDSSASMAATDTRPTRLEAARAAARRLVSEMNPGDRMVVIEAGPHAQALTAFSDDRGALLRAIDAVAQTDAPARMGDAATLAAALAGGPDAGRVDLFSDGAFTLPPGASWGPAGVVLHRVGRGGANLAIVAAELRPEPGRPGTMRLFVALRSWLPTERRVIVELRRSPPLARGVGGELVDAREAILATGAPATVTFEVPIGGGGTPWLVHVDTGDPLATDDTVRVIAAPPRPIDVLLVTRGNRYLQAALAVIPGSRVTVRPPGRMDDAGVFDVVVLDRWAPARPVSPSTLWVDCSRVGAPARPMGGRATNAVIPVETDHPLLRDVDLGAARWRAVHPGEPQEWAREIASAGPGAAIVAGESDATRALWLGFALDTSAGTFPLDASYPIFVMNAVRWLARAEQAGAVHTGASVQLDAPSAPGRLVVERPDGSRRTVTAPHGGRVTFADTVLAGFYRVTGPGSYRRVFAANLADAAESDIAPREVGPAPKGPLPGRPVVVTRPLWPLVLAGAVALLLLEWWLYHRRPELS